MALLRLEDLCLQIVVDNLDHVGDVGDTGFDLLEKILLHCTAEQLQRIEDATVHRDLSPVTDNLWQKCYGKKYGADNMETVARRMKKRGVSVLWRKLHEAKAKEQEDTQRRCVNRLRELYLEAERKKQSRKIQIIKPAIKGRKRSFAPIGSSAASSRPAATITGSRLFKKAKIEHLRSHDKMVQSNINKRSLPAPSKVSYYPWKNPKQSPPTPARSSNLGSISRPYLASSSPPSRSCSRPLSVPSNSSSSGTVPRHSEVNFPNRKLPPGTAGSPVVGENAVPRYGQEGCKITSSKGMPPSRATGNFGRSENRKQESSAQPSSGQETGADNRQGGSGASQEGRSGQAFAGREGSMKRTRLGTELDGRKREIMRAGQVQGNGLGKSRMEKGVGQRVEQGAVPWARG